MSFRKRAASKLKSKEQNRTPDELTSDLLRKSFSGGVISVVFTSKTIRSLKASREVEGIRKGREEIKQDKFVDFDDLMTS